MLTSTRSLIGAATAVCFALVIAAAGCDHGARNILPSGAAGQPGAGQAGSSGLAGTTGAAGTGGSDQAGTGGTGSGAAGTGGGSPAGTGGSGPAGNLVTNGDFSGGELSWHVENDTGHSINGNGQYCVTNPSTSTLIGWATSGANVMLTANTSYRISYQASASSGNVTMHVKVGLAVQPYTSDYETNETLNSGLQTFNHTFTPSNGTDQNMGIAFTFTGAGNSTVCLDNVSIVQN